MASYVAEAYLAGARGRDLRSLAERVRLAAECVTHEGVCVRHVQSVFLPADETCFHFFEAASAKAVSAVGERAGIAFDRVSEATCGVRTRRTTERHRSSAF